MVLYQSPEKHLENMQKDTPQPLWGSKSFFSRESDSRIANVRLSIRLSVRHKNPLASQNLDLRIWTYVLF